MADETAESTLHVTRAEKMLLAQFSGFMHASLGYPMTPAGQSRYNRSAWRSNVR